MGAFKIHIEPLYGLKPTEALDVAAAVMNYVFERQVREKLTKISGEGTKEASHSELLRWQQIIDRGILSGILVSAPYELPRAQAQSC